ncbi:MAG: hypothetical protein F4X66_16130 [Chloroflexi bacterium]|nr:hypothetical protein [Chloroflexota bacterium]MYE41903.1 hypothetical protein [Chloroflexota bacterium]
MDWIKNTVLGIISFHQTTALPALLGIVVGQSLHWQVVRDGKSYYHLDVLFIGGLALFLLHLYSQWVRRKLKSEIKAELVEELRNDPE